MSVRADNDAFNFWRGVHDRPDKEYTNGDEVIVEFSAAPWWGTRFDSRRRPWRGMHDRTDKEYTNGEKVIVEFSAAPWWGKRFASRRAPCTGNEPSGGRC